MSVSFDGVGQLCATFLGGGIAEGSVVKMAGRATVGGCKDGDSFFGAALCCKEDACTVQVGGFVTVNYSGAVPAVGMAEVLANAAGGIRSAGADESGRPVLVVDADTAAKTVTILL